METNQISKAELYIVKRPLLFWTITILAGIVLGMAVLSSVQIIAPFPAAIAGGVTVTDGIKAFSGEALDHSWSVNHTYSLISILVFYLLIPFIFFTSLKRWRQTPPEEKMQKPFRIVMLGLALSTFIFAAILFTGWMAFFTSAKVYKNLKTASYENTYKDLMVMNLSQLGLYAREYYYLPEDMGGGGNSWKAKVSEDGENKSFEINSTRIANASMIKRNGKLFTDSFPKINYSLKPGENDTVLYITASGRLKELNKSDNEVKARIIQMTLRVTPSSQKIVSQ